MKKIISSVAIWVILLHGTVYGGVPEKLMAVGQAVGIDVKCSGLLVVGFSEKSPARESGLHRGDLIIQVDGMDVSDPGMFREMLQDKAQVTLTALRKSKPQSFLVRPRETDGVEMIGASVKSEMAGIGTITYYDPDTGSFGALGHGVTDGDSAKLFPVQDGYICKATILTVDRGRAGTPGMLQGAFENDQRLGRITKNTSRGIFGVMNQMPRGELLPIAEGHEVVPGSAEVLCNVEGNWVERYQVEIERVYPQGDGKDMTVRICDEQLLKLTGGIVQGMSGSPIIQDGKLVGAVTHVLVNDPTRGYGIFIENMLEAAG